GQSGQSGQSGQQAQVVFIGQGSALAEIEQQAAALPALADGSPAVVFLGQQPPAVAASWQAHAQAALVSIVPGQGYDFAYPTKVLSALSCGVPVIYAGVGPVTADLADSRLGRAVTYDVAAVADAMLTYATAERDADAAQYRHAWIKEHRSTAAVGRAVHEVLREAAQRQP
ncbi:MAG: glycosyltransferase, partial [Bowdeniella nasicola]|nr:glycosyltransferase [Bowdeniella nasicola]